MRLMKDSGVEWIGAIPSTASIIKFKKLISYTNAGEVIDKQYWHSGEELLYTCQKTPMKSNYSGFPNWKRTQNSDLLLTRNGTPYVFLPKANSIYSNVVQRVGLIGNYDSRFVAYSLLCGAESLIVNGDTIPSYNMEVWKNIPILNFPICAQRSIADYLDLKCGLIDSIISKQEAIIENLKEYKLSVITEAVTKGLDPNVEMKDSGIEWLGMIPYGWKKYKIANLYDQTNERGNDELPILTVSINSGISDRELSDDEQDRVIARSEDRSKYKRVVPGDLAYNMMRAWQGAFGAVRVEGMVSPAYVTCRPKMKERIDTRYIEYLLRCPLAVEEMHRYSHGVADFRLRLYWPEFRSISLCLPSYEEQTQIANYIDSVSIKIDREIEQINKYQESLMKYKKSLIYEVVTGKREVA